jgi:hypothetical protein
MKITKAKEGKKNIVKFHLFAGMNLKIYDKLADFYMDISPYKKSNAELQNQIDLLGMNTMHQITNSNVKDSFEMSII